MGTTMDAREGRVLERLELKQQRTRWCDACGSPTAVFERDGALWLGCARVQEPKPRLRRVLAQYFPGGHMRRVVIPAAA